MTTDLAQFHHPVSTLFRSDESPSGLRAYALTQEQLDFYEANGYVAGVRLLNDAQVDVLREQLAELFDPQHPGHELWHEYHTNESADPSKVLFHALGAWRIRSGFHDALWNSAFTIPAQQLLGGPVRFWHDQLFCKPAKHGGVVAWHQDYSYWTRSQPMAHLTCWIGLDDATRDNGCMQYVPGSHRWDLLPITGLAGDMHAIRQVLNDDQWDRLQNPVAIELKKGEATFHHPLMVHGSRENTTDGPRRAYVINCLRDGVCAYSDAPLMQGIPLIESGTPIDGQFFPLLSR